MPSKPAAKKPAAKPAAKTKPAAAKKPASADGLRETAEAAEHELQTLVEDAAANGWQPVHAERCAKLAQTAAAARAKLGEEPAGHTIRFL